MPRSDLIYMQENNIESPEVAVVMLLQKVEDLQSEKAEVLAQSERGLETIKNDYEVKLAELSQQLADKDGELTLAREQVEERDKMLVELEQRIVEYETAMAPGTEIPPAAEDLQPSTDPNASPRPITQPPLANEPE